MSLSRLPALAAGGLALGLLVLLILWEPSEEVAAFFEKPCSLRITDRRGELLHILPLEEGLQREHTPLDGIPPELVRLMVQAEDGRFRRHPGVDPLAMGRALLQWGRHNRIVSGGSTITMQLARIMAPHGPHESATTGKLREMVQAVWLELAFSKEEILEMWLNHLPYGRNVQGVTSAARRYFGRELWELGRGEAAVLALLPRNPTLYDPIRNEPEDLAGPLISLLGKTDLMEGCDPESLADEMGKGNLRGREYAYPREAPHFVRALVDSLGGDEMSPAVTGGTLTTSLDLRMQRFLEESLNNSIAQAEAYRIRNGAALVLDNGTGEILAYVGSQDFTDPAQGQIDGVRALGQPGSTMKPFLYALAFEEGMHPATILPDIPLLFGSHEVYRPENFNNRYNGPVRLRTALASSLNIPAVYVLERVGTPLFIETLINLGFASLEGREGSLGTGIALGNGEVTLFELTRAFALFPRRGYTVEPVWLRSDRPARGESFFSERSAGLITDILSDPAARVTGFGGTNRLNTDFPALFKTGTSNQFNDIWALGAAADLTCGVWMGNFSGETVIGRPGSSLPAQTVIDFLDRFSRKSPLPVPPGVKEVRICPLSGELAGPNCTGTMAELIPEETVLSLCTWHREEGLVLPAEFRDRAGERGGYASLALNESGVAPVILHPPRGSLFYYDPSLPGASQMIRIEVDHSGFFSLLVDGVEILTKVRGRQVVDYPLEKGEHHIESVSEQARVVSRYEVR